MEPIKSLAELKAELRAKQQKELEAERTRERAAKQHDADAWRALLICAELDLHPELYAAIDREQPKDFTAQTAYEWITISLPEHSRIRAPFSYVREPEPGWQHRSFSSDWRRWQVEERYYYDVDAFQTNWRDYSDLGEALIAAENEGKDIAAHERDARERAAKQAEIERRQAEVRASVAGVAVWPEEKPAPEPTPAEVLADALDDYLRDWMSRNGYAPVE